MNNIANFLFGKKNRIDYSKADITKFESELIDFVKPFTMTSFERMIALARAVDYLIQNNIEGDFVECGVWKGGSAMLMAKSLLEAKTTDRLIYLYDTFEGMSEPSEKDVSFFGKKAKSLLQQQSIEVQHSVWCYSAIDEVKSNLIKVGYPEDNFIFVQGKVEDTIPKVLPQKIALLRLDTDWYESTKHELTHLYPLLVEGGILIIDDYGHWLGCKKAVDEFIQEKKLKLYLNRIDYTGRIAVKNSL
jgi:hypothetical protein